MLETVSKRRLFRDAILNVLPSILLLHFFFTQSGPYLKKNVDHFRELSRDDDSKEVQGSVYITLAFVAIGGEFIFGVLYSAKSHEVTISFVRAILFPF